MSPDNIQYKYFILIILLVIGFDSRGNDEVNIKLNSNYVIDFDEKTVFNYTNFTNESILIKVKLDFEVKLEISSNEQLILIDTPGHKAIPEFLVLDKGQSIRFSIIPKYKTQSNISVIFEKKTLNKIDYYLWLRLFENIKIFANGDLKIAAIKFKELAIEMKTLSNELLYITYFMSAVSYYDAQLYDEAINLFEIILNSKNKSSVLLKATSLNYKARTLSIKGYKLEAIDLFAQSSNLFIQIKDVQGYASSLNNIGLSYHLLGKLNIANEYYIDALNAFESINDTQAVANQYINIGGIYFMKGMSEQAKEYYTKAVELSRVIDDVSVEADALEMFAWLQQSQGNFAGLLVKWADILKIRIGLNDISGITRAYRLIGNSYLSYGNNIKALQFLNKSLIRAKEVTLTENYPVTLNNIAQAYYNLNDLNSSQLFYQKALDYNLEVKNEFYSASDFLGLSKISINKAKHVNQVSSKIIFQQYISSAFKSINVAIEIYNKSHNKLKLINAMVVKAEIFHLIKDYQNALKLIIKSSDISKNIDEGSSQIEIDLLHGKILLSMQKKKQAIKLFKLVLENANRQRHQIINPKYRATFAENLENCRNLLVQTLISESIRTQDSSLIEEALIISESGKAKSLNDLVVNTKPRISKNQTNKYKQLQNQLQTLYFLQSEFQEKPQFKMVELRRIDKEIQDTLFKLDVLEESIHQINNEQQINKNRVVQLQDRMDESTLYVAIRLINDESLIWHISKNKIEVKRLPKRKLIEKNIQILYDFFKTKSYGIKRYPSKVNASIHWLKENVFFDIDFIHLNKLVISPHGMIQLLPITILSESNIKFSSKIDISFTPSLMMEKRDDNKTNYSSKLLVVANPQFNNTPISSDSNEIVSFRGNTFGELKFTVDEARHIINLYGDDNVDLLIGSQSTKSNVLLKIEGNYNILHFATHGLIDPDIPEMSGLVFSSNGNIDNNILTIGEIINLNIQSNSVVLSACETAIGENIREEGLIGLSYAFLAAGANEVYSTLWKVGDRSVLKSIKKMYRNKTEASKFNLKIIDPFWVKYEIL